MGETSVVSWSQNYELSIFEHCALLVHCFGLSSEVIELSQQPDPQQAILDKVNSDSHDTPDSTNFDLQEALILLESYCLSMECVAVYGISIHDIIANVRNGEPDSDVQLLNAIRIDPNVISSPTAQDRLCRATLLGDKDFIDKLSKALKGKTGKQSKYLNDFRVLMQLLHECGSAITDEDITNLVLELDIYQDSPSSRHNINELIRKYKKLKRHF